MNFKNKQNFLVLIPQGWGFFTKDPKDVIIDAYEALPTKDSAQLLSVSNTSLKNLVGLSRNNRFVGYEISKLVPHIPGKAWKNKRGYLDVGAIPPDSTSIIHTVTDTLAFFEVGRDYILHQYKPIPYAWSGKGQEKNRPYLVARIRLEHPHHE